MNQGDIIKFKTPVWAHTVGQGNPPEAFVYSVGGKRYEFKWERELKVSTSCDPENKVANLDYSGDYPLIRKEFAEQYSDQIEITQPNTEE
jgi:hypothetical protein